jgi:hypothetical protein
MPKQRTAKAAHRVKVRFQGEQPIARLADDKLGRAHFAKAISRAINAWQGEHSLVISIYGRWGDGKSSVKGMVLDDLRKRTTRPIIVEFNPWEWAAQAQIASAFFEEIGKQIGEHGGKSAKQAEKRLRRMGKMLIHGANIIEGVGALSNFVAPGSSMLTGALATAVRKSGGVAESGAEAAKANAEILAKSLPEMKRDISEIRRVRKASGRDSRRH